LWIRIQGWNPNLIISPNLNHFFCISSKHSCVPCVQLENFSVTRYDKFFLNKQTKHFLFMVKSIVQHNTLLKIGFINKEVISNTNSIFFQKLIFFKTSIEKWSLIICHPIMLQINSWLQSKSSNIIFQSFKEIHIFSNGCHLGWITGC
jgi:hypothetical protein